MKKIIGSVLLAAGLTAAAGASAMDYVAFAKDTLLNCVHPTVSLDKARAELEQGQQPTTEGDITTARVRVFYKGWVSDNSMLVEIRNRKCGSINEIRADVLEDTGTGKSPVCKFLDGWQDI
jgi:hypothetical protein